jgi:hypothetical protein
VRPWLTAASGAIIGAMLPRIAAATLLISALVLPCVWMHTKLPYHKNRRSDTALFRFEEKGKAGFINLDGEVVIPPKFDVGWSSERGFCGRAIACPRQR